MLLNIDGKNHEVGFWSFLKCNIITNLVISGLIYAVIFFFGLIVGIFIL